jgi:hypothetical protein
MKLDLITALTTSTSASGFVDLQSKGGLFTQQPTLVSGIPAGASVTCFTFKRQVIPLGLGGYMSARYGE